MPISGELLRVVCAVHAGRAVYVAHTGAADATAAAERTGSAAIATTDGGAAVGGSAVLAEDAASAADAAGAAFAADAVSANRARAADEAAGAASPAGCGVAALTAGHTRRNRVIAGSAVAEEQTTSAAVGVCQRSVDAALDGSTLKAAPNTESRFASTAVKSTPR